MNTRVLHFALYHTGSVLLILLFSCADSLGSQTVSQPLVVLSSCYLVEEFEEIGGKEGHRLTPETLVVGAAWEKVSDPKQRGWYVRTLEYESKEGWLPYSQVSSLSVRAKELRAHAIAVRAQKSKKKIEKSFPELIMVQKDERIRGAWREIEAAIAENEKLPLNERLCEPYFARAEVWRASGNYLSALSDYLTGIRYARSSGRDLLSYSRQLERLAEVASNLESTPVPPFGSHPDMQASALDHFGKGMHLYYQGRMREALEHFDNAVQLTPDQPRFWYFRALAHKRLGEINHAKHDVLLGVYMERELGLRARREIHHSLVRIQGDSRSWLESYRLGNLRRDYPRRPTPREAKR